MYTFRNRVTLFSFVLTIMVIFVHAVYPDMGVLSSDAHLLGAYYLETFLGSMVCGVAVPGFFCISGYLFFRGMGLWEQGAASFFVAKWRRRALSLVVPFIAWNIIYYLIYLAAGRAEMSVAELVRAACCYSCNPVFWYLGELIILTLLSPVIWILVRRRTGAVLALAVFLLLAVFYEYIPVHIVNEDALFYYSVGAAASLLIPDKVEDETPLNGRKDFYIKYFLYGNEGVVGCLAGVTWVAAQYLIYEGRFPALIVIGASVLGRIAGVVFLYCLIGILMAIWDASEAGTIHRYRMHAALRREEARSGVGYSAGGGISAEAGSGAGVDGGDFSALDRCHDSMLPWFTHYNFFIYATHYLVIRGARLAYGQLRVPLILSETLGYILLPFIAAAVCAALGRALRALAPPLYRILSGWR